MDPNITSNERFNYEEARLDSLASYSGSTWEDARLVLEDMDLHIKAIAEKEARLLTVSQQIYGKYILPALEGIKKEDFIFGSAEENRGALELGMRFGKEGYLIWGIIKIEGIHVSVMADNCYGYIPAEVAEAQAMSFDVADITAPGVKEKFEAHILALASERPERPEHKAQQLQGPVLGNGKT